MISFKISRRLLSVIATLMLVAAIFAIALSGSSPAQAQDGDPGSPAAPAVSAADAGDGPGEAALTSSALGGDGFAGYVPSAGTESVTGPDMPAAPAASLSYYKIIGTAFDPRTSATTYAYNFNGCVYETGGTDNRFIAPLLLPDGATIKYLRLYFDDTNAGSDITAWLTRYQPGVTSEDLTSVTSTGSAGYGETLSPEITHEVDLVNWAYTIVIAPNANAVTNSFCGVRVAYYAPPIFAIALPAVLR